jgi:hypothetical protein
VDGPLRESGVGVVSLNPFMQIGRYFIKYVIAFHSQLTPSVQQTPVVSAGSSEEEFEQIS